jgi:hypothetical protein
MIKQTCGHFIHYVTMVLGYVFIKAKDKKCQNCTFLANIEYLHYKDTCAKGNTWKGANSMMAQGYIMNTRWWEYAFP